MIEDTVSLPTKILFSDELVDILKSHGKTPSLIQLEDSFKGMGIWEESISLRKLQLLVAKKHLHGLETSHINLLSKRKEVCLLIDSIYQVFIYLLLDDKLQSVFLNEMKSDNTTYTQLLFEPLTTVSSTIIAREVQKQKAFILEMKNKIAQEYISLMGNEQANQLLLDYLTHLDPRICLMMLSAGQKFRSIKIFTSFLLSVHKKLQISNPLGVLIVEMIMNAENMNIYEYLHGKKVVDKDIENMLHNPKLRNMVLENLAKNLTQVFLSCQILPCGKKPPKSYRLKLSLLNRNQKRKPLNIRQNNDKVKIIETHLEQYFNETFLPFADMDMTFCYLDSIKKICHKEKMQFDTSVSYVRKQSMTVINMNLQYLTSIPNIEIDLQ